VRTAEGASEKQSSLKARLRNGLTYLLTYLLTRGTARVKNLGLNNCRLKFLSPRIFLYIRRFVVQIVLTRLWYKLLTNVMPTRDHK